jgi:hypothetical protein
LILQDSFEKRGAPGPSFTGFDRRLWDIVSAANTRMPSGAYTHPTREWLWLPAQSDQFAKEVEEVEWYAAMKEMQTW